MNFIAHSVQAHKRNGKHVAAHTRYRDSRNLNTCPIRNAGHKSMDSIRARRAWIAQRKAARLSY